MPKEPLDPNSLRDEPEHDLRARVPNEQEDWEKFVGEINHLLVDPDGYGYAESTLTGIKATVTRTHIVTSGQRDAISNIGANPRGTSNSWKRRQEGFQRGGFRDTLRRRRDEE
jgi:hypothetical protein